MIAANKKYASTLGAKKDLALPPARGFAILTYMDARLDPAKYAGLSGLAARARPLHRPGRSP
jgi:carbonic anhydrase